MTFLLSGVAAMGLLLLYTGLASPRRRRWGNRLDRLALEAGMGPRGGRRLFLSCVACGVGTFVLVAGMTTSPVVGAALGAVAGVGPLGRARARRTRRRRRFREAWPDAIATLIAAVRAGVSLPEACSDLAERGPEDLRPYFRAFATSYRSGGSFPTALDGLRVHMSDPIADRVVVALRLAHEVGGTDLVRVLRTLGNFVRDDLRVRKEIEAKWSWTVTAARVAAAAPWIVLILMATRPEAAAAYNSGPGAITIVLGAVATFAGYRLMLRAARLPEDRRMGS